MALHLDGNPGISFDLINFCAATLETKNHNEKINFISGPMSISKSDLDP